MKNSWIGHQQKRQPKLLDWATAETYSAKLQNWAPAETHLAKLLEPLVLCSYYFTFRLWENWYELWVENFLRFTRETKIGLEKPILKFRVPAGHEKFQRLREANFCLPREPEKTFHEQFISVWAHPKGKIIRTDCFISFFGYLRVYDQ